MIKKQSEIKSLLGSFTVVFARKTGLHIGPSHATLERATRCNALRNARINRRAVRRLMGVDYFVDLRGRAVVLIGDGEAKERPKRQRDRRSDPTSARRTRLTGEQVREIRALAAAGESYVEISKKFPVSSNSISSVVRGNTYRWVK